MELEWALSDVSVYSNTEIAWDESVLNLLYWYSCDAFYHSVLTSLSSSFLSKNMKITIYRTVALPFVSYGCETWPLTFREEHRLRLLENRVLRRIFWSNWDKIAGNWRKPREEELNVLYSPDTIRGIKSRKMRWVGHVARMGERRSTYRILMGKPEGYRRLGRSRRR